MKHSSVQPTVINGVRYYTVTQFAQLVGTWPSRISLLVNAVRDDMRIPHIRVAGRPLIAEEEIDKYINARGVKE